jgi:hypothetical protein
MDHALGEHNTQCHHKVKNTSHEITRLHHEHGKCKKITPIYAPNLKEFIHHTMSNYFKVANEKYKKKKPNT